MIINKNQMTEEKSEEEPPDLNRKNLCILYNGPEINGNPTFTMPYDRINYDPNSKILSINGRLSYLKPVQFRLFGLFEDERCAGVYAGMFAEELGISIALSDLEKVEKFKVTDEQMASLDLRRDFIHRDPSK